MNESTNPQPAILTELLQGAREPWIYKHSANSEAVYNLQGATVYSGLPWWLRGKEFTCNAGDAGDLA